MSSLGEKEMECRTTLGALDGAQISTDVQAHVDGCAACATQRRVAQALRAAVVVEAPPELSARLLALAAPVPQPARLDVALKQALMTPAPAELSARLQQLIPNSTVVPAKRPAWVMPVYALTAVLVAVLLIGAGQVYGLALQQLGVSELWHAAAALPSQWLTELYAVFPQGRYVVDAFLALQRALQGGLIGLRMWAVLEMLAKRPLQGRQASLAGS